MYAIIKDGSRQFKVSKGAEVEFDRKSLKAGDKVEFTDVLLLHDGEKLSIGSPTVKGARVVGEVLSEAHGPKLRVFKFRRREGWKNTVGHKQKYSLVRITDIVAK